MIALLSNAVAAAKHQRMIDSATRTLRGKIAPRNLTAPLIMTKPDGWHRKKRRIVIFGQETMEWGAVYRPSLRLIRCGSLAEAKLRRGAVLNLAIEYQKFMSSGRTPFSKRGFWQAYEEIVGRFEPSSSAALWGNVVCVAFDAPGRKNMSMFRNLTWPEVDCIARWQFGRLKAEIAELEPTDVFFLSGPDYDYYLLKEFPGLGKKSVSNEVGERQLARLCHTNLPFNTFRTYHPNARVRDKKILRTIAINSALSQ